MQPSNRNNGNLPQTSSSRSIKTIQTIGGLSFAVGLLMVIRYPGQKAWGLLAITGFFTLIFVYIRILSQSNRSPANIAVGRKSHPVVKTFAYLLLPLFLLTLLIVAYIIHNGG